MKEIIVISLSKNNSATISDDPRVEGEFDSIKDAREWIKEDAKDTADNNLESGRHEGWGSTHLICRIEQIVIPVPKVTVDVSLKRVKI